MLKKFESEELKNVRQGKGTIMCHTLLDEYLKEVSNRYAVDILEFCMMRFENATIGRHWHVFKAKENSKLEVAEFVEIYIILRGMAVVECGNADSCHYEFLDEKTYSICKEGWWHGLIPLYDLNDTILAIKVASDEDAQIVAKYWENKGYVKASKF